MASKPIPMRHGADHLRWLLLPWLVSGCGDLPTEAVGTSSGATVVDGTSSSGPPDPPSTTETGTPPADDDTSSSGAPPDPSTSDGSTSGTSTDDGGSSSSGDTGEPLPNCGDGLVAMGELCHDLGPAIVVAPAPDRIAIADLDLDGALDVLTTTATSPAVHVLWGVGDGNFVAPQLLLTAAANIDDLAVDDFSGDGRPDLVITDSAGSRLVTYANDGAGGLFFAGLYPCGLTPQRLALGDVDGDGTPDLVAAASGSATLLLGNGLAGFIPEQPLTLPAGPHFLTVQDLDLDNAPDLLTVNSSGGNASSWRDEGTSFGASVIHDTAATPRGLALGDIDGNGAPDLLVAHPAGDDVGVLLNGGLADFGAETLLTVADDPRAVALVDLDLDGHLDLAVAHTTPGELRLHKGVGDGTFMEGTMLAAPGVVDLWVADLDDDGVPDLVMTRPASSSVQALLSDP